MQTQEALKSPRSGPSAEGWRGGALLLLQGDAKACLSRGSASPLGEVALSRCARPFSLRSALPWVALPHGSGLQQWPLRFLLLLVYGSNALFCFGGRFGGSTHD
jgi:hypothetical protein